MTLNPLLKHFVGSKKRFKNGFGSSSGPGPELAPKPLLKHFSVPEQCFRKGFGDSFEARLALSLAGARPGLV